MSVSGESKSESDSKRNRNRACLVDQMPPGLQRPLSEETTVSRHCSTRHLCVCVTAKCQNDESTKKPVLFNPED